MTFDDYKKMAAKLTDTNAPDVLNNILEGIKVDLAERDALVEDAAKKAEKIADLQQTNIKLFLSQTGKEEEQQEEKEPTPQEALADLVKTIKEGD